MQAYTVEELAEIINISPSSIYGFLKRGTIKNIKLKKNLYQILEPINHLIKKKKPGSRKGGPYSSEEKEILIQYYTKKGAEFCQTLMTNRSLGAIGLQARKMGLPIDLPLPEGYKKCSRCFDIKQYTDFGLHKREKDGRNVYCKLCLLSLRNRPDSKNQKKNYDKNYSKNIRKFNKQHILRMKITKRIKSALKSQNAKKISKTTESLGCSLPYLRNYLELKFHEGMTWENHGFKGWHIDHIIPCSAFDLTDLDQQKICFHYSNLQPLWWYDNLKKGDSIVEYP